MRTGTRGQPLFRPAARALMIEPGGRVLLIHHVTQDGYAWWAAPGGGIDAGESPEDAARREVLEETGLLEFELGPCVWRRVIDYPLGGVWYRQPERYYLVRVPEFPVRLTADPSPSAGMLREHRWWAVPEIRAAAARFAPRSLADLLERLLLDGPPPAPIEVL